MSRRPDPAVRQWWRELLESFDAQCETVAEFCQRHEVSTASFYTWRRRLADESAAASSSVAARSSFVPVELTSSPSGANQVVSIHLPGEVMLEVPCAQEALLLKVLERFVAGEENP